MTNVLDAINELIKGINVAYARNAYSMQESRALLNAIEFIGDAVKNQQAQVQANQPTAGEVTPEDKPI